MTPELPSFSEAQRFVLHCLAGDRARAESALAAGVDFEVMVRFALRHEVVGEITAFLSRSAIPMPQPITDALGVHAARLTARRDSVRHETLRIGSILAEAEVPAFFAKGAVWDAAFRQHNEVRTIKDIDVYIRLADLRRATERLVSAYDGVPYHPIDKAVSRLHHHSIWAPSPELAIEVHWAVAAPWNNLSFDVERALSRARAVELEGGTVRTLACDDAIVFCALDLAKESWTSLKKLVDFAMAVERGGEDALVLAFERARMTGCARMLRVSLLLAKSLDLLRPSPGWKHQGLDEPSSVRIAHVCLRRLAHGKISSGVVRRVKEGVTLAQKHDRLAAQLFHLWRVQFLETKNL